VTVVAVDFAASLSACVVLRDGEVVDQFDSVQSVHEFLDRVVGYASVSSVLAVEDLPHNLKFAGLVKQTCRLQGELMYRLRQSGLLDRLLFVPPACWQRYHPGVWRQDKAGAHRRAVELGYQAPDLLDLHASDIPAHGAERSKYRERLKKAMTDYDDAFLIAWWAEDVFREQGTYDVPSTQRVA